MSISPSPSPEKVNSNSGHNLTGAEVGPNAKKPILPDASLKREAEKAVPQTNRKLKTKSRFSKKSGGGGKFSSIYWKSGMAGLLGLFFLIGIFLAHSQLKKLVLQIEQKRSQWVAFSEKGIDYKKLSADLNLVEDDIPLIENAFPDEDGVISFFDQLRQIEEETNVVVGSYGFEEDQPRKDKGGNSYLDFALEATGNLDDLESFFNRFFTLPILMRVETVSFEELSTEEGKLVFKSRLYLDPQFLKN